MRASERIFAKKEIIKDKLIEYGFNYIECRYEYRKNIKNNQFTIVVLVDDSLSVDSYVMDNDFNELYTNVENDNLTGGFVGEIKEEYNAVLHDIADKCCKDKLFTFSQSNRVSEYIFNKYGISPNFLFEDLNDCGVFRNNKDKWFAFIAKIKREKITSRGNDLVEIIVLKKCDWMKYGSSFIYPGYHMNKKSWVTIILDNTMTDNELFKFIDGAYQSVSNCCEWIVPANPKFYDVIADFKKRDTIEWKMSSPIKVGDIVYLYVGSPYSEIKYKCEAVEVDIPYKYEDENLKISRLMRIRLLKEYTNKELAYSVIANLGVKMIRGPRYSTVELNEYISKIENNK